MEPRIKQKRPPRWADRILEWYCHPALLEEIQGDAYELFYRDAGSAPRKAAFLFWWNVFRFFRWRNIRRFRTPAFNDFQYPMLKNIFTVSVRHFFRNPAHTGLNALGLTIGFSSALLIMAWVLHEFSFDRFHEHSDRIFKVVTHAEADGSIQTIDAASAGMNVSSIPEAEALVTISDGSRWPHILCFRPEEKADECIYLNGIYASPSLFDVFSISILSGDHHPINLPNGIAVSRSTSQRLYGDQSPLGKTIKIDGWIDVTITAVYEDLPANSTLDFGFVMPFSVLATQWGISPEQLNGHFFKTFIKTHHTVSADHLNNKLNNPQVLSEELKKHKVSYRAVPLTSWRLHSKFEDGQPAGGKITYVKLFITTGLLILTLAVINYLNMSTARATSRAKEIGIRKVTGAYRESIILQFFTESFLLVLFSFFCALILSKLSLPFFNTLTGETISLNLISGETAFAAAMVLLVVAIASGTYPALVMSGFRPVSMLGKSNNEGSNGAQKFRKSLLIIQVTIALCIVNLSAVIYYQLNYINNRDLGFEYANTLRVEPTANLFRSFEVFKNELKKDPSIVSVGTSNLNPIGAAAYRSEISWPGKSPDTRITFQTIGCSYEFPETIGLKLLNGRPFYAQPSDSMTTEVLVTADAVAAMDLADPIGQHIDIGGMKCVIIGVVNNFHTESLHQNRLPVILYRVGYMQTSAVYVRYSAGSAKQAFATLSNAYKQIEPSFTMKYWYQDEAFDELYKTESTVAHLILIFTCVSLIIALIGIITLSTYNVVRKRKEISIRRVFGARAMHVMRLLGTEFGLVMIVSLAIATPLSWFAADEWLSGFAYHTSIPVWLFPATFGIISAVTLAIVFLQGSRTIGGNPAEVLRGE